MRVSHTVAAKIIIVNVLFAFRFCATVLAFKRNAKWTQERHKLNTRYCGTEFTFLRYDRHGRGDFCIKRLKIPRVLLMGRIYASIPTSHSLGGFMQNTPRVTRGEVLCKADLHNLPRKCVHTRGRFYAKESY